MGAVSSALAAGVIFYFMIIAAANIKIVLDNNVDEINEIEIDEEVKRLDILAEKWRITYQEETHWSRAPTRMRAVLTSCVRGPPHTKRAPLDQTKLFSPPMTLFLQNY